MWPVFVLLWNHCLMRKRYWIRSLSEFIFPIIYFLLIDMLSNNPMNVEKTELTFSEPFVFGRSGAEQGRVLYKPDTKPTNQLMDRVGAKLNLHRLSDLPRKNETGYFPFSKMPSLQFIKSMKPTDFIVIFEGMESDTLPMTLKYTIRLKDNFKRHKYNYVPEDFTNWHPRLYIGTPDAPFLHLQWAIDTSYISLKNNTYVDKTLMLQELPDDEVKNNKAEHGCALAFYFLPVVPMALFTFLTDTLFEGKNSGIHDLIKIVGVSWEALCASYVLNEIPNLLMYAVGGAIFFKVSGIVRKTSCCFIAVAMGLHFMTVVSMAFVVVYAFKMTDHLIFLTSGIYFLTWVLSCFILTFDNAIIHHLSSYFLPHYAFAKFWTLLAIKESLSSAITASNMWNDEILSLVEKSMAVGNVYLCMLLQIVLSFLIAWYLARVRPGKYGQALPWNFICKKAYWRKKHRLVRAHEVHRVSQDDQQYFERSSVCPPVGIQIINVHKSFGKEDVLRGVNLTVYKGEITILLGHNGAGKSTLISIITGLTSATSGRVLVDGKDTVMDAKEVRKTIGLCPQENIFFPHLTVLQHVMFFGMLKGEKYKESKASALELLNKLQLASSANLLTEYLSGGMRRRAQFACAVTGGATVLIMDEPTSGLDVDTRRELWNMLQSLRCERTVLLTTHFMEEADALGDRVVALHHGVLRCHATSMFLKRAVGTGYRISCTTIGAPNENDITTVITSKVPDATLRDQKPNGLTYDLPANETDKFPKLLAALEERRLVLDIDTISFGKNNLDDVFITLCCDEKPTFTEEGAAVMDPLQNKETGAKLWARQFKVLMLRQWHYFTSALFSYLFNIPFLILLLWLVTAISNNSDIKPDPPDAEAQALNLDLFAWRPQRRALVNVDDTRALSVLRTRNPAVTFQQEPDIAQAALRIGIENIEQYEKYLVGIELRNTSAKVLYTGMLRHAAPVALNLLSNTLAARQLNGDGRTITTRFHALSDEKPAETAKKQPKESDKARLWGCHVVFSIFMCMCAFAELPSTERVSGTRVMHVMAGCHRALLWAATLTAHLAQALVLCALPAIICAAAVDKDHTFNQPGFLGLIWMLFLLGFLAFLGLLYFVSSVSKRKSTRVCLFSLVFICTMITTAIQDGVVEDGDSFLFIAMAKMADMMLPPHTLAHGLQQASYVARANAFCVMNRNKCPDLGGHKPFDDKTCCGSPDDSEPYSYLTTDGAAGMCVVTLFIQAVVYLILMYLSDSGLFSWLLVRKCSRPKLLPPRLEDPAVRDEDAYVSHAVKLPKNRITDAILCHNIQKSFLSLKCCKKKHFFPAKNISFSVKKGECFGLLGVNGAGVSTMFKMLTGEIWPTRGDIISDGQELRLCNRNQYLRTLSYCPQFFGVDDFLTGRQHLVLLLTLCGLHAADVKAISDYWIKIVGLEQYADKRVSTYSSGCARRLAVLAALCQCGRTALLDEPTAGVDPVARRGIHQAMLLARRTGALVIASHSLEEIEGLCHRITVMSSGELRALVSASALKTQYGTGYSIMFKLYHAQHGSEGRIIDVALKFDEFKAEMQRRFNCTLLVEHQKMLSYKIKDIRYSELFESIEGLKQKYFDVIEDYTITETSLAEGFLAFAKDDGV